MASPFATRKVVIELVRKHNIRAERYLDLGCADGTLTMEIAKLVNAKEICGIDINEDSLRKAHEKGIQVVKVDLNTDTLPFREEYFDLITAIEVIEHLRYADAMLKEAYRVLKRRGQIIISTPNLGSWFNRFLLLFGYQPMHTEPSKYYHVGLPTAGYRRKASYAGHVNLMTLKALEELLRIYGFKIIERRGVHWHMRYKLLDYVDRIISKIPSLAHAIVLIAIKI